jgi:hypothetical protein
MPIGVTDVERWFLEVVVDLKYPVACLASPNLRLILNRAPHGLGLHDLVDVLGSLHGRELIFFEGGGTAERTPLDSDGIVAALSHVHDHRYIQRSVYFGMTALGGDCWENVARPDWSRFVDESYSSDPHEARFAGVDREHVARLALGVVERIGGTERSTLLTPWKATYWKELPLGHELRFLYRRDLDRSPYRVTANPWAPAERDAWFCPVAAPIRRS